MVKSGKNHKKLYNCVIAQIKGILFLVNFMKKKLSKVCMLKECIPCEQESFDSEKVFEYVKRNELMKTMTFGNFVMFLLMQVYLRLKIRTDMYPSFAF